MSRLTSKCDYCQFGDKLEAELRNCRRLHSIRITMPRLLDVDIQEERIVKEYIEGKTVYEMVLNGELPPCCMEQVKKMCALLHPAQANINHFPISTGDFRNCGRRDPVIVLTAENPPVS